MAACRRACPAGSDIPQALFLIEKGKFIEAAGIFRKTNFLPEICGRVCPQERLCEGACVLKKIGDPVLIGVLESFACEYERREKGVEIQPGDLTGRKVAIVGAGPSGLACADVLIRMGHWVTIYDTRSYPGGALTYGFPNFKLPHALISDIWNGLKQAGVTFVGNTLVGKKKKTVNDLFEEGYEAVFLGVGSGIDAPLEISGEDLPSVYKATEFLIRANADKTHLPPRMRVNPEVGKRVVVIGGGDPATDCARTALRLGAKEVTCLYRYTEHEIPGRARDRILAIEEGVKFEYLCQPVRLIPGPDGDLAWIDCVKIMVGEPDEEGQRYPEIIEGSNFIIDADTAIVAMGYYPDPIVTATTPGLKTQKWGMIVADRETGATSRFGVFTGGDVVTGPDMVVTAVVAGRKAGYTIDAYLG
ncbi:MAG: dihydropyrimidine dehydrogenase [Anaerolineales bacterium]|nr:MAG: dihydropyrimidine dehydrogenase [Anaerolineales bacterium]